MAKKLSSKIQWFFIVKEFCVWVCVCVCVCVRGTQKAANDRSGSQAKQLYVLLVTS